MKTITATIQGTTALIQHRFGESAEVESGSNTRRVQVQRKSPREEAEEVAYLDSQGRCYHPGAAIARLLREAGGAHKQKGSRKSLKYIVPAAVRMAEDTFFLLDLEGKLLKTFEVDSRPVVIPSTKGRVMRHRPRHDAWMARFDLVVNETLLHPDTIHQLLVEGGQQLGIGDYRPEKGGPFGTFMVTGWVELGSKSAQRELVSAS